MNDTGGGDGRLHKESKRSSRPPPPGRAPKADPGVRRSGRLSVSDRENKRKDPNQQHDTDHAGTPESTNSHAAARHFGFGHEKWKLFATTYGFAADFTSPIRSSRSMENQSQESPNHHGSAVSLRNGW